jgi:AcrR family transcriptional regulator
MHISPRLLRAEAETMSINKRLLTDKEVEREARILDTAQRLMASFTRGALSIAGLAGALGMAPATIRRHFVDIDSILAEILVRHLLAVCQAIGRIPRDQPGRAAALRAAYLASTRTAGGGLTEAHLLLLRERHTLPTDLAEQIESFRQDIGRALAGGHAAKALSLLDNTELQAQEIATLLGSSAPPRAALPAPKPAEPQARSADRSLTWSKRYNAATHQQPDPACNSP